jgi:hypothetical protein
MILSDIDIFTVVLEATAWSQTLEKNLLERERRLEEWWKPKE